MFVVYAIKYIKLFGPGNLHFAYIFLTFGPSPVCALFLHHEQLHAPTNPPALLPEPLDRSVARLHELARKTYPDKEEDHIEADRILCDMLDALGCQELTEAFDAIDKWYA